MTKNPTKQKRNPVRKSPSLQASEPAGDIMRDTAYEDIKHRIITCEFKPGTCLNEAAVATLIGVGRTPVHQALDRLRIEGMIEVIPRKGAIVRPLILREVLQMIEVRSINESYCAKLAAERANAADIRFLGDVVKQAREAIKARDVKLMMTLDRDFHLGLAQAAGNDELADLLRRLNERSLRFWFVSFTSEHHSDFQAQHESILEAVKAKDPAAAGKVMEEHIDAFRQSVTRHLSFHSSLAAAPHAA
jgi:DNA-binding GntR family transcriptional regulator